MRTNHRGCLRSVILEAGRQAAFYAARDPALSEFWFQVESLAMRARAEGAHLVIDLQSSTDPIIKDCEQVEQLPNPLDI